MPRTAQADEIKKAYRTLARKYRPDVSKEANADCGALSAERDEAGDGWRFNHVMLCHIRRMACLERDFDAVPELAVLVIDLEEDRRLGERLAWMEAQVATADADPLR